MNAFPRIFLLPALLAGAQAQTDKPPSMDGMVDRIVQQEQRLMGTLQKHRPIAEIYLQLVNPIEGGVALKNDLYFIGKIDLSQGIDFSFLTTAPEKAKKKQFRFLPHGFAQMTLIDNQAFDRNHYTFTFVRREFLGEVRCLVFDLTPGDKTEPGRFIGRIWVEDESYNVVRFSGTYTAKGKKSPYSHFNSWRMNTGPGLWLPAFIYCEELDPEAPFLGKIMFKGQVRIWGYQPRRSAREEEFTKIVVEAPDAAADQARAGGVRGWQLQAEQNIIERMEMANLLSPPGPIDKILGTVVNNLIVTNKLELDAPVNCRVLLTSPLESFNAGHTIVLSRGLIDVLPDEASLAAVLAQELAHILLGHALDTKYAFNDRILVNDADVFRNFQFRRTAKEIADADAKAIELMRSSPYKDKLASAGLFLRAVANRASEMPNLFNARMGNPVALSDGSARLDALVQSSPALAPANLDQIPALPLGSRVRVDPWTSRLEFVNGNPPKPLSAHEKMVFEVTPFMLPLARQQPVATPPTTGAVQAGPARP